MMECNSCTFPIGEKEKKVECESCGKHTHSFCLSTKDEKRVCDVCLVRIVQEVKAYEFELPDHVRRTDIETYRKCPLKFKMEKFEGHQQPPTNYTQVGIDLHDIFDKAVNNRSYKSDQWRRDYEENYLKNQIEMGIYENDDEIKQFNERAETCMKAFEELLPSLPMPLMTEETIFFEVSPGLPKVRFTMDYISENEDGGLDLADWKTGKELVGKQLASDLQAPIYIYGVEKELNRRVDSFTFYYLNTGKVRRFERVSEGVYVCKVNKREYVIKFNEMVGEIQGLFTKIKQGQFNVPIDSKGMFFTCKMCHIKKKGLCLGSDQEAWTRLNGGV